jgi:hypothetical protein
MTRAQERHAAKMRAQSTTVNMRGRYKIKRRAPATNHATPWQTRRAEYLREVGRDTILRKEARP